MIVPKHENRLTSTRHFCKMQSGVRIQIEDIALVV